jgi:hypothetical protein
VEKLQILAPCASVLHQASQPRRSLDFVEMLRIERVGDGRHLEERVPSVLG